MAHGIVKLFCMGNVAEKTTNRYVYVCFLPLAQLIIWNTRVYIYVHIDPCFHWVFISQLSLMHTNNGFFDLWVIAIAELLRQSALT